MGLMAMHLRLAGGSQHQIFNIKLAMCRTGLTHAGLNLDDDDDDAARAVWRP